jgi:hypothetical protein
MTVLITLTTAGTDTGPFNLFSDANGFTSAFETNVSRAALLAGYTTSLVPNGTTIIRVMSTITCKNYSDFPVAAITTTTTSSSTAIPLLAGRYVTIPVPVEPAPNLIISYTNTNNFFVAKQVIPASGEPVEYYLCILCGTTIIIDDGTPDGPITYDDIGTIECNCLIN